MIIFFLCCLHECSNCYNDNDNDKNDKNDNHYSLHVYDVEVYGAGNNLVFYICM